MGICLLSNGRTAAWYASNALRAAALKSVSSSLPLQSEHTSQVCVTRF